MVTLRQHKLIGELLNQYFKVYDLYAKIQEPGHFTVQVCGTYHPEFQPAALREAKDLLWKKANKIAKNLRRLGFCTRGLKPLRERAA